jgi:lysophospholipase L1-like esterase
LLAPSGAFLVVLTVGANDIGSSTAQRDFGALIDTVKPLSARSPVAVAVADARTNAAFGAAAAARGVRFVDPQLPPGSRMADGKHFTATGYKTWLPALETAISKECNT